MTTKLCTGMVLGLCFTCTPSIAQERGGFTPAPSNGPQVRMGQPSAEELKKVKEGHQKWLTSLKLTPEQKKKWDEIETRYGKQLREKLPKQGGKEGHFMISGSSGDALKVMQEIQVIQKKKRDEQRALLTPAQRTVFDKAPDPGFRTRTITR